MALTPAEWVARVLDPHWKTKFDTYEEMARGIWADTPGASMTSKIAVLMLDVQNHRHGWSYYVRYNDVVSLICALETDCPDGEEEEEETARTAETEAAYREQYDLGPDCPVCQGCGKRWSEEGTIVHKPDCDYFLWIEESDPDA